MTTLKDAPVTEAAPIIEPEPSLRPVIYMVAALVALISVLVVVGWGVPVLVVGSLFIMIMAHELGHFTVAKATGMKATEFFVGFGPRLWSYKHGETEYGVKAIPVGGYVRIVGFTALEEVDVSDEARSYMNQSFSKRIAVSFAGPAVHFILAIALAFVALFVIGTETQTGASVAALSVWGNGVTSPAQAAGLRPGDVIVSVNGQKVGSLDAFINEVHASPGVPLTFVIERGGTDFTKVITPVNSQDLRVAGKSITVDPHAPGLIGIEPAATGSVTTPRSFGGALAGSFSVVWQMTTGTVSGLAQRFSPSGLWHTASVDAHPSTASTPQNLATRPTSVVGMFQTLSNAAKSGALPFLEVFIAINVAIGLLNLIPMVPLDGGHIAIAAYERLRTKKGAPRYRADITKLFPFAIAFGAVLVFIIISAIYLDIANPIPNPFSQ